LAGFDAKAFLREARRRQVFRAAALYVVGAWAALQVADLAFPGLGIDDSAIRYVWIGAALGLPIALILAWRYDIAGGRIRRTRDGEGLADLSIGRSDYLILSALAVVIVASTTELGHRIALTRDISSEPRTGLVDVDPKSIAVLPFVNMSASADSIYFAQGIAEELLNLLTRIPGLHVSSRTSSFHFADKDIPLSEIASDLGVRHILEGSVRRQEDRVRVTVQLIDAATDSHLWSATYDRELTDIFDVQDEIAGAITQELQLNLDMIRDRPKPTVSNVAHDLYLRGMHVISLTPTPDTVKKASELFRSAIREDPNYADAHAWLSLSFLAMGNLRMQAPTEVFPKARAMALEAEAIDPTLASAKIALGWIAISYDHDWETAEANFRKAIELAPGNASAHQGLAWPLQIMGRYDEALQAAEIGYRLDPFSAWTRSTVAEIAYKMRDYNLAMEQVERLLDTEPDDHLTITWRGQIFALTDRREEAIRCADQVSNDREASINNKLFAAVIYAMVGDDQQARAIVEDAERISADIFVAPGAMASVYANLGDTDRAIELLEEAIDAYDSAIFNLDYPKWDAIRTDPRFIDICRRMQMACAPR
jgi:adenylate cyclase